MKIVAKPNRKAPKQAGRRNCRAETPTERATTSSYFLLSEMSVAIAENRATNGIICCMMKGTRMADRPSAAQTE